MSSANIKQKLGDLYWLLQRKGREAYVTAYEKLVKEEREHARSVVLAKIEEKNFAHASDALTTYFLRRDDLGEYGQALGCFYRTLAPHYPQYEEELLRLCRLGVKAAPCYYDRNPCTLTDVHDAYEDVLAPFVLSKPEAAEMMQYLLETKAGGELPERVGLYDEDNPEWATFDRKKDLRMHVSLFEHELYIKANRGLRLGKDYFEDHPWIK